MSGVPKIDFGGRSPPLLALDTARRRPQDAFSSVRDSQRPLHPSRGDMRSYRWLGGGGQPRGTQNSLQAGGAPGGPMACGWRRHAPRPFDLIVAANLDGMRWGGEGTYRLPTHPPTHPPAPQPWTLQQPLWFGGRGEEATETGGRQDAEVTTLFLPCQRRDEKMGRIQRVGPLPATRRPARPFPARAAMARCQCTS